MRTKHLLKPLHVRRSLRVLFFPCMEFLFRLLVPLVELGLYGKGYSFSDSGTIHRFNYTVNKIICPLMTSLEDKLQR